MRKNKKKSKKNTIRNTVKNTILLILLLTLGISTALLTYLHFFASGSGNVSGEWTAELDMTERAAAMAFSWLQDIEAVSVSLEDMESCMQGLNVQVEMTLEQTGRNKGTFRCTVLPESYDACNQAAYEVFAAVFRELLTERLRMAGYAGSMDEEVIEALVNEAFGMSTISYLMTYGPALLPSLEDLQAEYEGSGTYETAEGILIRQFDADWAVTARAEYYTRTDFNLVLLGEDDSVLQDSDSAELFSTDYPVMYTLKQPQDQ